MTDKTAPMGEKIKAHRRQTAVERATAELRKRMGTNACIPYWGQVRPNSGYGRFHVGGRRWRSAHTALWVAMNGPLADGMVLDHLCRNRSCVNPAHLEVVTAKENTLRGLGPTAANKRKTHCKHGHTLSGDNLYSAPDGDRICRTCQRGYDKDRPR